MFTISAKRVASAGLLICLAWFMANCSKNPQDAVSINEANNVDKVLSAGMAEKDLKPEFEKLATLVSQRASRVIGKIIAAEEMATDKVERSFAELKLDADLPITLTTSDGRVLEITLEWAQPCEVTPATPASAVIFAPDPDRFLRDDEAYMVKGLLVERGSVTPISFTLDDYARRFANVPLYFVGYQDHTPVAQVNSLKKTTAALYLACSKLHMKKDLDPGTNEECEVYTMSPGQTSYNMETSLIFNGGTRLDAANRSATFPDVNNTSTIYTAASIPAFFPLLSQTQGWVAIEEDVNAGTHNRDPGSSTCIYCPRLFSAAVTVCSPNWVVTSTVRDFVYWYSGVVNSDDIWQDGCYEGFDLNWAAVGNQNTDYKYSLNGNEFWVQAKMY